MPGARCTRSLACKIKKHTSKSPRSRRNHPAFPAQWFTTYNVIFPVIGLCCHRRLRNYFRQLDASVEASEPHDFAVRLRAVRQRHISVHRIPPRVRDDRERPCMGRDGGAYEVIWPKRECKCFCKWGWTHPKSADGHVANQAARTSDRKRLTCPASSPD